VKSTDQSRPLFIVVLLAQDSEVIPDTVIVVVNPE